MTDEAKAIKLAAGLLDGFMTAHGAGADPDTTAALIRTIVAIYDNALWWPVPENPPHELRGIICVEEEGRDPVIGEARYLCEDLPEADRGWWWAQTSPGDYYSSPVHECNFGRVTKFRLMPPTPCED